MENISHGVDFGERVHKGMKDLDEVVIWLTVMFSWRAYGCTAARAVLRDLELHRERVDGRPATRPKIRVGRRFATE